MAKSERRAQVIYSLAQADKWRTTTAQNGLLVFLQALFEVSYSYCQELDPGLIVMEVEVL